MKVQTPRGTRDLLGKDMKLMTLVLSKIRKSFEKYGFEEARTPAFENFDVLAMKGGGGTAIKDEIYYFQDKSKRELGLRFDFTVPLARMFACNPTLPKPYKRFQIGQVWRYDRPGKGRYREFTQADVDILGVSDQSADTELIGVLCDCMKELGVNKYVIKINSRKIADGIITELELEDRKEDIFRSLDKLEKIGKSGVEKELISKKIPLKKIKQILEFIKIIGQNETIISALKERIKNEIGIEGIWEVERIIKLSKAYGIQDKIKIDLSLIRGMNYYTGFIMELKILGEGLELSCAGGGRYDNLIETYGSLKTHAVGFSFGVDRLCEILKEKIKLKNEGVFIALQNNELEESGIALVQKLRNSNIKSAMALIKRSLSKQIKYAVSKDFKYLIVLGEKEIQDKKVKVKDLGTGKEKTIETKKLADYFSKK